MVDKGYIDFSRYYSLYMLVEVSIEVTVIGIMIT